MRLGENCRNCLYNKEICFTDDEAYLAEIKKLLDDWDVNVSAPYMEYIITSIYKKHFGESQRYGEIKKQYNDLVLSMESIIKDRLNSSAEPLREALFMARIGNYIDFAAMENVDSDEFLSLLFDYSVSSEDKKTYASFLNKCENGNTFLLITDNCGEVVLDRIMLEKLRDRFPNLKLYAMVRESEVLNDATADDASYVGLDKLAELITNGGPVAGVEYGMLPARSREILDGADIVLSKGQGNFESCMDFKRSIYHSFLCKCDVFQQYFNVPKLTGMFIETNN